MKIAHLASFKGNIGDVLNHEGLYASLRTFVKSNLEITQLEIRDFYRNNQSRKFDDKFSELINQHDLFIIGGGNFFEVCWDYSSTGTTIDISEEILQKIETPIYINAIGVDDGKGVNEDNLAKFEGFLRNLIKRKAFITVRNDGSYEILQKYFDETLTQPIYEIPDSAFAMQLELQNDVHRPTKIGFNIVSDMKEIRFGSIDYSQWLMKFAKRIETLLEHSNSEIIFFPHIYTDYIAILEVMNLIHSKYSRQRISICGLVQGRELDVLEEYKQCKFVFASRFHSNIACFVLGIPNFGTLSYHKHGALFDKMGLSERKAFVTDANYFELLDREIDYILNYPDVVAKQNKKNQEIVTLLNTKINGLFKQLANWFQDRGINYE